VVFVAAAAVLSACTVRVGGAPVAGTTLPPEPEELTAEYVFGDLTTVAPCSLTDPEAFEGFGPTTLATPESLDYCAVRIDTGGEADVLVSVGTFGSRDAEPGLDADRVRDVEGGLWIGQQDDTPMFCSQLLVFPDDVTLQVAATIYEGSTNTCPMVEAGMDHVVDVVLDGEVGHREPAEDSLVTVDPCGLVEGDALAAVPGLAGARQPNEYPGRHTCLWEVGGGPVTVRLEFAAGPAPSRYAPDATEGLVAGRQTITNPLPEVGEHSYCTVSTGHIDFDEVKGEDAVEIANVFVRMPAGQVTAGCAAAAAVAALVWPELPAV
jgi:hypothetical protein